MRRLFDRLRRVFPLRAGALILLAAAAALVFLWAPKEADFLLYPAGLVALLLVVVCTVLVVLGTWSLRRTVKALAVSVPERLETTRPTGTGFRIPSLSRWLVLDVGLSWVEPLGLEVRLEPLDGQLAEVVTAKERGRYTRIVRRFTVEDVFGLTRSSFDVEWTVALAITPASAKQGAQLAAGRSQGETLANPAGRAEGDLVEMRQYAYGDSMRHVLWKVYARSRKLLVRMPERALAPGPISVAFFVAGVDDEASAGAARLYVEAGLLGADLLFTADGSVVPARSARDAVEQLVDSATQRGRGGEALDAAAAQIDPGRLTSCVLFVPPVDGAWRERVVGFVRKHSLSASVIIGVDEVGEAPAPPSRLNSFLFQPDATLDTARPSLKALRAALEAEGLPVKVLHRTTGQIS
ncbi:MAG: DUF58 domain-containing protein [Archangium sp.]|nr:DUF58 domain-containing protein [Archangium sp.]MDP3569498.1 DUF58 domain-containing protein [Archangium sp.]